MRYDILIKQTFVSEKVSDNVRQEVKIRQKTNPSDDTTFRIQLLDRKLFYEDKCLNTDENSITLSYIYEPFVKEKYVRGKYFGSSRFALS